MVDKSDFAVVEKKIVHVAKHGDRMVYITEQDGWETRIDFFVKNIEEKVYKKTAMLYSVTLDGAYNICIRWLNRGTNDYTVDREIRYGA